MRVQDIHAAADPDLAVVDVYVGDILALDDFAFGTASPYHDVPVGTFPLSIAPGTSTSVADAFYTTLATTEEGRTYQAVISGVFDPENHQANPDGRDVSFQLIPVPEALEAGTIPGYTDYRVLGAATDLPTVDVTLPQYGGFTIATGVGFGDADPLAYAPSLPLEDYVVDLRDPASGELLARFRDVSTVSDVGVVTFVLTGFLTPEDDESGPRLTMLRVTPDGATTAYVAPADGLAIELREPEGDLAFGLEGGRSRVKLALANDGQAPLDVDVWVVAEQTAGGSFGPAVVRRPKAVALAPDEATIEYLTIKVPSTASAASFRFTVYVGDFDEGDPADGDGAITSVSFDVTQNDDAAVAGAAVPEAHALVSGSGLDVEPNPTAGLARVRVAVEAGPTRIEMYDALGRAVAVLHESDAASAAVLDLTLDGRDLPPGRYVVRATTGGTVRAVPITVVR